MHFLHATLAWLILLCSTTVSFTCYYWNVFWFDLDGYCLPTRRHHASLIYWCFMPNCGGSDEIVDVLSLILCCILNLAPDNICLS